MMLSRLVAFLTAMILIQFQACASEKGAVKDLTISSAEERKRITRARLLPYAGRYRATFSKSAKSGAEPNTQVLAKARIEILVADLTAEQPAFESKKLLNGNMSFGYLAADKSVTTVDFFLNAGMYDPNTKHIYLKFDHDSMVSITLNLSKVDGVLQGLWLQSDREQPGTVHLESETEEPNLESGLYPRLAGQYAGTGFDPEIPRQISVDLETAISHEGISQKAMTLNAKIKISAAGTNKSEETITYTLSQKSFDPLSNSLTLSSPESPITFEGIWNNVGITGHIQKPDGSITEVISLERQP